jgi:hypothetical protein
VCFSYTTQAMIPIHLIPSSEDIPTPLFRSPQFCCCTSLPTCCFCTPHRIFFVVCSIHLFHRIASHLISFACIALTFSHHLIHLPPSVDRYRSPTARSLSCLMPSFFHHSTFTSRILTSSFVSLHFFLSVYITHTITL